MLAIEPPVDIVQTKKNPKYISYTSKQIGCSCNLQCKIETQIAVVVEKIKRTHSFTVNLKRASQIDSSRSLPANRPTDPKSQAI